jgi:O-antigen/teichoic acid export membrane protein
VVTESVAFLTVIAIARLVPPSEYGRAAIVGIVWLLVSGLNNQGFGAPIVQRRTVSVGDVRTSATLALATGAALSLVTFFAVPPLAGPLFGERTADLFRIAAPIFLIGASGIVPMAILQRHLDFRRASLIEMGSVLIGSAAAVGLALGGLDAEAIVFGHLVQVLALNALRLVLVPRARPGWQPDSARALGRSGLPLALSAVVYTGYRNLSYPIVGATLGTAATGFFSRAFQFSISYPAKISEIMLKIAFPAYARTPSLEDIRRLRKRIVRLHALAIFPLLALLIVVAPSLIPWLLGENWAPAVAPVQILSGSGMAMALITGLGPLLTALDRGKALLAWDSANGLVTLAVVFAMSQISLLAVCWGVLGVYLLQLLVAHAVVFPRVIGIPFSSLWTDVKAPASAGVALAGTALLVGGALEGLGLPTVLYLAATGAASFGVYAGVLRLLFPSAWADVTLVASRVLGRQRREAGDQPAPPPVSASPNAADSSTPANGPAERVDPLPGARAAQPSQST